MTIRLLLRAVLGVALASACGPSVIVLPPPRQPMLLENTESLPSHTPDPRAGQPETGLNPDTEVPVGQYEAPAAVDESPLMDTEDADPASLQRFRSDLDEYGQWIEDARYGTVWVPYSNVVGVNFRPYVSAGRWSTTANDEWLWVSDYPFGGVVFHYGRWVWIPSQGWAWVAGSRYAPAWVQFWVADGGYIGWAPLSPMHIWRAGAVVWIVAPAPRATVFVPRRHVYSRRVSDHIVGNSNHAQQLQRKARLQPRLPSVSHTNAQGGETQRRAPQRIFSSEPGRTTTPALRSTFAGPKMPNKVLTSPRPSSSAKPRTAVPQRMDKPSRRNKALQPKRRAADSVVIAPIVKPPVRRPARADAPPPRAHKSAPVRKAHPPMPRVRKIPQEMKRPPRRITPPPRGRHTAPAPRRRH